MSPVISCKVLVKVPGATLWDFLTLLYPFHLGVGEALWCCGRGRGRRFWGWIPVLLWTSRTACTNRLVSSLYTEVIIMPTLLVYPKEVVTVPRTQSALSVSHCHCHFHRHPPHYCCYLLTCVWGRPGGDRKWLWTPEHSFESITTWLECVLLELVESHKIKWNEEDHGHQGFGVASPFEIREKGQGQKVWERKKQ